MILGLFFIVYFAGWYFAVEKGIDYTCKNENAKQECKQAQESSFFQRFYTSFVLGIVTPFAIVYQWIFK